MGDAMDWGRTFSELMGTQAHLAEDELAAALLARGCHALAGGAALAEDASLLRVEARPLLAATLYPGVERLRARFDEARASLNEGGYLSEVAERAMAAVLQTRDQWRIRIHALAAVGAEEVAGEAERRLAELDGLLRASSSALGSVAWSREDALAASPIADSIWKWVPEAEEIEPGVEDAVLVERVSEDDLARVALGTASSVLEQRVMLALAADPVLRARYDRLLEDVEEFESTPVVPLPLARLLRTGPHEARPAPQRLAAEDRPRPQYEEPSDEDEVFVFADGSQLFAQRHEAGWVLFLFRVVPSEDDAVTGPSVVRIWKEGRLLGVEAGPGEVQLRCNGQVQLFQLGKPPE